MSLSVHGGVLRLYEISTGRHILALLEELNRIQWLSRDELLARQRDKLISLVEYADRYVPYYQRVFKEVGFRPDDLRQDLSTLNKIPILNKPTIRKNWDDLLTTEPERRRSMSKLNTSGSTGEPLLFMQDGYFQDYVTAETQHHMSWLGWKLGDNHAWIYIAPTRPSLREKARVEIADWAWNRFQLNACSMTEESMTTFARRLRRQKTKLLWCCTSSLYHFAQYIRTSPYRDITFDGIFTTAEVLLPAVRQFIEETFRCRVFNRYGTMELGGVACECQAHTGYHICADSNYIEILHRGLPAKPEELGPIIVTNLNNRAMPFIRYSIGDVGAWTAAENCPCGRSAPMLSAIEGRITEMFQTRDGRYVRAAFSGGFRCLAHPAIKQFQIIQKSLDKIVVRLVPDGEIPQSVLDEITQTVQATFGRNVMVDFEFPTEIAPLPSGKHQYAISELNRP
jgi:phenylacetate-CoA ligase